MAPMLLLNTLTALTREKRNGIGRRQFLNALLNSQVLVLNRLWQAVNICSARRAFALVYQGHAQVVSSDPQNNFLTHDFASWRDFSVAAPEQEMVTTISWKI